MSQHKRVPMDILSTDDIAKAIPHPEAQIIREEETTASNWWKRGDDCWIACAAGYIINRANIFLPGGEMFMAINAAQPYTVRNTHGYCDYDIETGAFGEDAVKNADFSEHIFYLMLPNSFGIWRKRERGWMNPDEIAAWLEYDMGIDLSPTVDQMVVAEESANKMYSEDVITDVDIETTHGKPIRIKGYKAGHVEAHGRRGWPQFSGTDNYRVTLEAYKQLDGVKTALVRTKENTDSDRPPNSGRRCDRGQERDATLARRWPLQQDATERGRAMSMTDKELLEKLRAGDPEAIRMASGYIERSLKSTIVSQEFDEARLAPVHVVVQNQRDEVLMEEAGLYWRFPVLPVPCTTRDNARQKSMEWLMGEYGQCRDAHCVRAGQTLPRPR